MTVHLMTVGNSIREYLAKPGRAMKLSQSLLSGGQLLDRAMLLGQENSEAKEANAFLSALDRDPARGRAAATLQAAGLGPDSNTSGWTSTASAEATSLQAVTGNHRVAREDLVVLIATDTVLGLLSAFWNAAFFLDGDLERLSYLEAPGDAVRSAPTGSGVAERGRVLIARVPGMDLRDTKSFDTAMAGLGTIAKAVLDSLGTAPEEKVAVHLSGGYKATLPFMLGIAEGLRSVLSGKDKTGRGTDRITAHVIHEESLSTKTPQTVSVPLRRFPVDAVREELKYFDEDGVDAQGLIAKDIENGLLLGYAYDRANDQWQLTPFGYGLRALIGQSSRAVP